MNETSHEKFEQWMRRCIALARSAGEQGGYAVGAIVAQNGEVKSDAQSNLIGGWDPTAHPEVVAIRRAAEESRSRYLPGAVLVSTLEPCPMCTSAAIWAKMAGIVFGASQGDAEAWARDHPDEDHTWRQIPIRCEEVVSRGTPRLWVKEGVLLAECRDLFRLRKSEE